MRHSHTTQGKKAKCLAYRNGQRCGRVATRVVTYKTRIGSGHQARCAACAQAADVTAISQSSDRGFYVSADPFAQVGGRYYKEVN